MTQKLNGLCVWAVLGLVPLAASAQSNPFDGDEDAIKAGAVLYASRCADCHSADAKGDRGPDLTAVWATGTSDARIFTTIRAGIEGSIMIPSFAPDEEIWATIAYLKSISTVPPFEHARGDIERGREVFASTCMKCHSVNGQGGGLGPDLSRIARVRTLEALIESIRRPSAGVALGYRAVTLRTASGDRVRGAIKAEDAFSLQLVDTDGRLQGYIKSDLRRIEREDESLMPEFDRRRLSDAELDDLLSYLATLRGQTIEEP